MRKIALLIEYDGTRFAGWQFQPNLKTVQGSIETAIAKASGCNVVITGAGRTDAGVHASGQVASFSVDESFTIPLDRIQVAINSKLPRDIRVLKAVEAVDSFNARFSALAREYVYQFAMKYSVFNRYFTSIPKFKFDPELLFTAQDVFLGKHDFTAFSKNNPFTRSYVCNVDTSFWEKCHDGSYKFTIKADRFVYGMVRSVVGAMFDVARNRRTVEELAAQLDNQNRDIVSPLAPPEGLVLNRIYYHDGVFVGEGLN